MRGERVDPLLDQALVVVVVAQPAAENDDGGAGSGQRGDRRGDPEPFPPLGALFNSGHAGPFRGGIRRWGLFDLNVCYCFGHEQIFLSEHGDSHHRGSASHK